MYFILRQMNYSAFVAYPPTEEQLFLINWIKFFDGPILLSILRFVSLLVLLISLVFWIKIIVRLFNKFIAYTSSILILISPVFMVLWLCHPIDCFKLLAVVLICYFFQIPQNPPQSPFNKGDVKPPLSPLKKGGNFTLTIMISFVVILCFNIFQFKDNPAIFHKISLKDAQIEATNRFSKEDSLTEKIKIPLLLRRVSYNKYFIEYKILMSEVLGFFDIESVFFQEVHPMEQKSVVLFFWPELFLFMLGLYWVAVKNFKFKKNNKFIWLFLTIAFVNFIFSSGAAYRRLFVILLPISLVLAIAFERLKFFIKKNFVLSKISAILFIVLICYGFGTNLYDFSKRPDYWLDNRPLAYDFIFKNIKKLSFRNYKKIHITSIIGNSKQYCKYYLRDCDNFIFESFDLKNFQPDNNSLFAGFAGEFIGSDFKNNISVNWENQIKGKGLMIVASKNLRDTIAYKFGNDIVIAQK